MHRVYLTLPFLGLLALGFGAPLAAVAQSKAASDFTKASNLKLMQQLPFQHEQDFEDARRGFIAPLSAALIKTPDGAVVWDSHKFAFIKPEIAPPDTVNPSLWRQSQLLNISGLFKVTDRLYQVRSQDLSNMTIIEGDTGLIVIDPLISTETARAALDLYYRYRPEKPVVAVIYSHSHVDHYGGVKGIISEEDVQAGRVKIYAPNGFLKEAVSENILAGTVMSRRASYMYGNLLPAGPTGNVGNGLGIAASAGTITLIPPTDLIMDNETKTIDGLTFEFMLTPGTEAPAEMHWYIPRLKALSTAENACHLMHNVYTLRGAPSRSALDWSKYINSALVRWGNQATVLYSMHTWPVWDQAQIVDYLKKQRDTYRYINDQTLRLANQGYTMDEIAEMVELPPVLSGTWASRGYYGTLSHNIKGTYVKYLGFFDGNPANLHRLPPVEGSKKYVEAMGGQNAVLAKAKAAYDAGDYRWASQILNHLVFAEPENQAARELEADTLEQLGYQAESGPWRNFYLTGAQELRQGVQKTLTPNSASPDTIRTLDLEMLFDYLALRLNGPKAASQTMILNFQFPDIGEQYLLELENGVLNHTREMQAPHADSSIALDRSTLNRIILKETTLEREIADGNIRIQGNPTKLKQLLDMFDPFDFWFNIVTP